MLENIDGFNVMTINEKSDLGYILEVDLEYPKKLRELHNDYPLAPEKLLFLVICYELIVKTLLTNMT